VLVDVAAMLKVPMPVVQMVDVALVLHGLAAITGRMSALVGRMNCLLDVALAIVNVIDVILVPHGLTAIVRKMFVVGRRSVLSHRFSWLPRPTDDDPPAEDGHQHASLSGVIVQRP
jgi:hypothetical protein